MKDFFGRLGLCTRDQMEVEAHELGLAVKKKRKTFNSLETGAHAIIIDDSPGLEWYQAHLHGKPWIAVQDRDD